MAARGSVQARLTAMRSKLTPVLLLIAVILLAAFPFVGEKFYIQLIAKVMIMAIFAMSLDLLVGYTGLVSLGHAAFFGLAGYVLAKAAPQYAAANLWTTLALALVACAIFALLTGFLVLRTSGIYFIMVTLAFSQMLFFVFHDTPFGGGSDGMYIYAKPEMKIGETALLDLETVSGVSIVRAVRPGLLSREAFAYLAPHFRATYYFGAALRQP